jgi:uncharacterized membrane protein (UPF0136 family)
MQYVLCNISLDGFKHNTFSKKIVNTLVCKYLITWMLLQKLPNFQAKYIVVYITGLSCVLAVVMGLRFLRSFKFMPAGLVATLRYFVLINR